MLNGEEVTETVAELRLELASARSFVRREAARKLWKLAAEQITFEEKEELKADTKAMIADAAAIEDERESDIVLQAVLKEATTRPARPDRQGKTLPLGDVFDALPDLENALTEQDTGTLCQMIDLAGHFGPFAAEYVPSLGPFLSHGDTAVKISALKAVFDIGPAAGSLTESIAELLSAESFLLRWWAATACLAMGRAAKKAGPTLCEKTRDADETVRNRCWEAISSMGESVIPVLAQDAHHDLFYVRCGAVNAMGWVVGKETAERKYKRLKDARGPVVEHTRLGSIFTFCRRRAETPVEEENDEADIPAFASRVLPQVREAMQDTDAAVKHSACEALRSFGAHARSAVPELLKLLSDDDDNTRAKAIDALSQIKPPVASAEPELLRAMSDSSLLVRIAAQYALATMGVETVVPALILGMSGDDGIMRSQSCEAVKRMPKAFAEKHADELVASLCERLNQVVEPDVGTRCCAAQALGTIGPAARLAGALGPLRDAISSDWAGEVQYCAREAVQVMQPRWLPKWVPGLPELPSLPKLDDIKKDCAVM